ncbi:MAG: hypothetical protein V4801_34865 [Burkholderia gladioli]
MVEHRADIGDQVHGREDVRDDGHVARHRLHALEGDQAAADVDQPLVQVLEVRVDIHRVEIAERRDENIGRLRLDGGRISHGRVVL